MTELANPAHRVRWREQCLRIASELKQITDWGDKAVLTIGIVLDDCMLKLKLPVALIEQLEGNVLGTALYDLALKSLERKDHRAPGESAAEGCTASAGMERGRAEAEVLQGQPAGGRSSPGEPPASAVSEQCRRKVAPEFVEQCKEMATGGVRLVLFASQTIQKRYGRRPLLELIMDLPVCAGCFSKMTAAEVLENHAAMWGGFSKEAQRRNQGVLPVKEETVLEHVPFDHSEYVALRKMEQAANDPQPGTT